MPSGRTRTTDGDPTARTQPPMSHDGSHIPKSSSVPLRNCQRLQATAETINPAASPPRRGDVRRRSPLFWMSLASLARVVGLYGCESPEAFHFSGDGSLLATGTGGAALPSTGGAIG